MTGQEIETAVRHRAPNLVVIFRNRLRGTIALHQVNSDRKMSAVDVGAVDFAGWARGLGAERRAVSTRDDLDTAVREGLSSDRPCVLDARADPDVLTADSRLADFPED